MTQSGGDLQESSSKPPGPELWAELVALGCLAATATESSAHGEANRSQEGGDGRNPLEPYRRIFEIQLFSEDQD